MTSLSTLTASALLAQSAGTAAEPVGDQPWWLVVAIVGAFLVVFPLFWCAVVFFLSRVSGWSQLAQRYATDQPVRGRRFGWVSGMVGFVSYRNTLDVHVDADGFFLEVMWFFRPGHRRLFIPYAEIAERRLSQVVFLQTERIDVGTPRVARMHLPRGLLPTG